MKNKNNSNFVYSHKDIEKKWQIYWEKNRTFYTNLEDFNKPKKYVLPMFPYPSGSGLHVGHVRNYAITDAMARFYRMMGFNVLLATGWDAFGLPSEQYAIQTNNHPSIFTNQNIERFKEQLKKLGFSYDWSKEINTSDKNYYKWTQWIFKQIFLSGLAEYKNISVFWCEKLATVLSNEEIKIVNEERVSERGSFPVIKKSIPQWILKITDYGKDLLSGINELDWPISIKNLQRNWIGISEGTKIKFKVLDKQNLFIEIFTTRPDTIYGSNSIAISPSSLMIDEIVEPNFKEKVSSFCEKWKDRDINYLGDKEEVFGEFTGSYCINPVNKNIIPIWVTNFVFSDYGTGSLMISPFHKDIFKCKNEKFFSKKEINQNKRIDYNFSLKYDLPIIKFVKLFDNENISYINSPLINELEEKEKAIDEINSFLFSNNYGKKSFSYHLKDWVFSRQRYWGEPIPIIHLKNGEMQTLPDEKLPLELPYLSDFKPSPKFYSPLQKLSEWVKFDESEEGFRDVNVMPQWAGSCWYYLAFLLKINNEYLPLNSLEAKKIIDRWMPVDLYVGGQEHANLHLLYARFWYKFLYNIGVVKTKEPFKKLFCQGMILGKGGEKMSKSKGNVISPDICISEWGSDSLRLYELFLSSPEHTTNFEISGVSSMNKWLNRVYSLFTTYRFKFTDAVDTENCNIFSDDLQRLISEITDNYHNIKLNLVVSKLMEFINICYTNSKIPFFYGKAFLQMLNPLAPHITEEIWSFFENDSIALSNWPNVLFSRGNKNEKKNVVIQVNGRKRDIITFRDNSEEEFVTQSALNSNKVSFYLTGKKIKRIIFIKNKIINFITE